MKLPFKISAFSLRPLAFFILLLSTALWSATTPVVDTVTVPVDSLKLDSTTQSGGKTIYWFHGLVRYTLAAGDSLNVKLALVPVGADSAKEIAPYDATGDVRYTGSQTGPRTIRFKCSVTGPLAAQYKARVAVETGSLVMERKIDSLINLMTLDEKLTLLMCVTYPARSTPGIPRLGIPQFHAANGPLGVKPNEDPFATIAVTCFPAGSASGNTWDTAQIRQLGVAFGREFRATGEFAAWAPGIDMVRDIRHGRAFETFGEEPYLNGWIGTAMVRGMQSTECVATIKHFTCYNKENNRQANDIIVSERANREVYSRPFEICVREGGAWGVMDAYPLVNGNFNSDHRDFITDMLKNEWGFRGFVVSDFSSMHNTVQTALAGMDLELPSGTQWGADKLKNAVLADSVPLSLIDDKVRRMMRSRYWTNVMTEPLIKYSTYLNSTAHNQLVLETGKKSIVLAKNTGNLLPLNVAAIATVAILGNYADSGRKGGEGSSEVTPHHMVTPRQGILNRLQGTGVTVTTNLAAADAIIVVVGINGDSEWGDRGSLTLTAAQDSFVSQALAVKPNNTIVVFTGGSATVKSRFADAPAVLIAWYPGQEQGNAIAAVLFGDYNPAGRTCVTWPMNAADVPNWYTNTYESVGEGRGYKYYEKKALPMLYPFGHGLSYTSFVYSNLRVNPATVTANDTVTVQLDVRNSGARAGEEVVQLYIKDVASTTERRVKDLCGFQRIAFTAGETKTVTFKVHKQHTQYWNDATHAWAVEAGQFQLQVGASSQDIRLTGTFTVN